MSHALILDKVSKKYGEFTAVSDLSLSVPSGSVYGFLGPNGAGKTTTIRMILDIIRPSSGSISILGADSAIAVRNRIGYLPEEKGLYKKMKASAIIAYFASLKGMDSRSAKRRAIELLERYGLGEFANAKTETLSKGMQQKLQVLASIAHKPDFVILDEPFSGLDPVNQQVMEKVIRDMASAGTTVLFSTHVMEHAERICDRIVLIAGGLRLFDGTVEEARRCLPKRVVLQSSDDLSPLHSHLAVSEVLPCDDHSGAFEFRLKDGHDAQEILHSCFEQDLHLDRFDRSEPSLHDVFVHLVGPEAAQAKQR